MSRILEHRTNTTNTIDLLLEHIASPNASSEFSFDMISWCHIRIAPYATAKSANELSFER